MRTKPLSNSEVQMTEVELNRLAEEIAQEMISAEERLADGLRHAILAGHKLIEAKGHIKHGGWLPWLESNGWAATTARAYVRIAKHSETVEVASATSVRQAIAAVSEPKPATVADLPAGNQADDALRADHDQQTADLAEVQQLLTGVFRCYVEVEDQLHPDDRDALRPGMHRAALALLPA